MRKKLSFCLGCLALLCVLPITGFAILDEAEKEAVFTRLKGHVENHIDHLNDFISDINELVDTEKFDTSLCIKRATESLENIRTIKKVLFKTEDIEGAVYFLMQTRIEYLKSRTEAIQSARNNPLHLYGKTNPKTLESLLPEVRLLAEVETDTYQTYNALILGLLSLTDLPMLKPKTKKAICVSPTLWHRIQGLDDDLGHPDEAILNEDESWVTEKDVYLYKNHFLERYQVPTRSYAGFYKFERDFTLTPFEYSEHIPPLEYPDFLKRPNPVVSIPSAPIAAERSVAPKEVVSTKQIKEASPVEEKAVPPPKKEPPKERKTLSSALPNKHLKTWKNIFDPQGFKHITFEKFQSLWEYLGGTISSNRSGGSHRTLIWQNETMGGTFTPHGGRGYGHHSIRGLRDALRKMWPDPL